MHAAVRDWERVMQDCLEWLCNGYSGLIRTHATNYHHRLSSLLTDAPSKGAYGGGYGSRVSEGHTWLEIDRHKHSMF